MCDLEDLYAAPSCNDNGCTVKDKDKTAEQCTTGHQNVMVWFRLLVFNGSFSTNRLYHATGVRNI